MKPAQTCTFLRGNVTGHGGQVTSFRATFDGEPTIPYIRYCQEKIATDCDAMPTNIVISKCRLRGNKYVATWKSVN